MGVGRRKVLSNPVFCVPPWPHATVCRTKGQEKPAYLLGAVLSANGACVSLTSSYGQRVLQLRGCLKTSGESVAETGTTSLSVKIPCPNPHPPRPRVAVL